MSKKLILFISIATFIGCKSIQTKDQKQRLSISMAELGAIGIDKSNLLGNQFQQIGVPELTKKVRIQVVPFPFDKNTYKKYSNLMEKSRQANIVAPSTSDSIVNERPKYLQFAITDLVTMAESLNAPENKALQTYLENDSSYKMIRSVAAVAPEAIYNDLLQAEEIYLSQHSVNKLGLELMKDGALYKKINLAAFTPFDYSISSFCWGKDNRNRTCIKAIVDGNTSCPNDTHKKAAKLENKNDFKF